MDSRPPLQSLTLAELVLRTGILALKVLMPMLWLQSKLSPFQFLVGGAALVLVVCFIDLSPPQDSAPSRRVRFNLPTSKEMDAD